MTDENRGRIVELCTVQSQPLGLVDLRTKRRPVFLDLLPDAQLGDLVEIQSGFATRRVNAAD